jgi:hypothetical protein
MIIHCGQPLERSVHGKWENEIHRLAQQKRKNLGSASSVNIAHYRAACIGHSLFSRV